MRNPNKHGLLNAVSTTEDVFQSLVSDHPMVLADTMLRDAAEEIGAAIASFYSLVDSTAEKPASASASEAHDPCLLYTSDAADD